MRNLDLDVMFQRAACLSENLVGRQRASAGGGGTAAIHYNEAMGMLLWK